MSNEADKKVYTAGIFIASFIIFIFSLFPGAFLLGEAADLGLSGAAGSPDTSPPSATVNPINLSNLDNGMSIASGLISILAAVYGIQLTRSEFAKLKASQIDKEMQRQEIEKLRIELELEKIKIEKKKAKLSPQRQAGKAKAKPKQDAASKLKSKKVR